MKTNKLIPLILTAALALSAWCVGGEFRNHSRAHGDCRRHTRTDGGT